MVDYSKLQFYSGANTYKNTGVFDSSITLSGSIANGVEQTFTNQVFLNENQVFTFATAKYAEFAKVVSGGDTTLYWQPIPTFDGYIASDGGDLAFYLVTQITGRAVTFLAGTKNILGVNVTLISQTVPIRYTTYTLAR